MPGDSATAGNSASTEKHHTLVIESRRVSASLLHPAGRGLVSAPPAGRGRRRRRAGGTTPCTDARTSDRE